MTPTKSLAAGLGFFLVSLGLVTTGAAFGQGAIKSDARVKIAVKADKPDTDGTRLVAVTLTIDKGWHLYANPVGQDDLADAQTRLTAPAGKAELIKVDYPAGKLKKDALVGDYKIYEDTVTITARVRPASGVPGPPELALRFQACSEKTCLSPATVKIRAE
jgi:hypothetical protein